MTAEPVGNSQRTSLQEGPYKNGGHRSSKAARWKFKHQNLQEHDNQ